MPGQQQYPEEESLEAPEKLVEALGQLHKEGIFVPPAVDQAVLRVAGKHLRRLERPRARRKSWLPWAAMAACLALAVWLTERFSSPVRARPLAREDINRDGRVDVLDAFALARRIDTGGTLDPGWDINGDGHIDRVDVNAIAARAVSLAQSGPEPKRSVDLRPDRADNFTIWNTDFRSAAVRENSFREGGAGDPPAPPGDSPGGMAVMSGCDKIASVHSMLLLLPSGGSPDGTGGSPVLPIPNTYVCEAPAAARWNVPSRGIQFSVLASSRLLRLVLRTQQRSVWPGSPAGWWQPACKSKESQS